MNCENFENIINDLARAKMMDAVARERGLAHAETCDRCADRLAGERALTAGLKALSASDEGKVAPDRVEAALLVAFRQQPIRERVSPRWALAAAAAVILVAIGLIVYRALNNAPSEKRNNDQVVATPTPAPEPVERKVNEPVADRQLADNKSARPGRTRWHPVPRSRAPGFLIRDEITLYARDSEVASDFFPLTYEADMAPMESGQLIRVQMPRSALVSFGLPVNVERADAPVTADLLVGEDGLARAIRFVR